MQIEEYFDHLAPDDIRIKVQYYGANMLHERGIILLQYIVFGQFN